MGTHVSVLVEQLTATLPPEVPHLIRDDNDEACVKFVVIPLGIASANVLLEYALVFDWTTGDIDFVLLIMYGKDSTKIVCLPQVLVQFVCCTPYKALARSLSRRRRCTGA